jgi:peptidyl-prolyl cis-trans isomerase SurA
MDTIKSLQVELDGYRKQLATSYLLEKELTTRLINEMYERRKEDVNISHILFQTRRNAAQEEIDAAIQEANKVYNRIKNGESFKALAITESDDKTTSANGGNLGWITAWLPSGFYNLENAAYNTPVGAVSEPIVTKLGVHLIKVMQKRPAFGKIEVAHILVRHDTERTENIEEYLARIHNLVTSERPFDKVAMTMSEDKATALEGGKLKPFGINTFDRKFEEAAYALKKDGDISEPVETKIGWHIIKRISKPTETLEEFKLRMKPQLQKLDRFQKIQEILVEEIKKSVNFQYDKKLLDSFMSKIGEEFYSYNWRIPAQTERKKLFSFGSSGDYTLLDFAEYLKSNTQSRMKYSKEKSPQNAIDLIFADYVKVIAMDHNEKNLENKYPDFKSLMREYSEGILLFEISKEKVWDKASKDTNGLVKFYNENRNKYFQPTTALVSVYSISTSDEGLVRKIYNYASTHSAEETKGKFNNNAEILIVEQKEIPLTEVKSQKLEEEEGSISVIISNTKNNITTFKKVEKIIPLRVKPLNESRGYVIADYQQYLEEQWVENLRKEYNVNFNDSVLNGLIK